MTKSSARRRKKKKHTGLKILLALVLILVMAAGGSYVWYQAELKPVSSSQEKITVEITEGQDSAALISSLKEKGLIKSDLAAKLYLRLNKGLMQYPGNFELSPSMSTPEIFDYLSDPANKQNTYAVVTIPEGKWARDEAKIISEALPSINEQDLLNLWNDQSYIETLAQDYPFLDPAALNNDSYFVRLEGYLFPDTYYMDYTMTPDQITRMLLDQFEVVYDQYKPQIEASGYSVQELLTFASIVQFESGRPDEMKEIAGVLKNRLDQGMPLQCSVTVCYALYDDYSTGEDCEVNTDIDSPYNTYIHNGLPIGPILNPGAEAIDAALNPADNDYLYFVSDVYGDGKTYFARTYEEHQANIERFNLSLSD